MIEDPYLLDGDSITTDDLLESKVTEDDVLDTLDSDGEVLKDDLAVLSDNGFVTANLDVVTRTLNGASDEDNGGIVALDGPGYDVDLLSCVVASGTCEEVGETVVSESSGLFVIPTGDPMDT